MKKHLLGFVMLVSFVISLWAWDYDKEVDKYFKTHPDASAESIQALKDQKLMKGMDLDSAKIVGKLITRFRNWANTYWAYCDVEVKSGPNETGEEITTATFSTETKDFQIGHTYIGGRSIQNSQWVVTGRKEWLVETFKSGKLETWVLTEREK